MKSMGDFKWMVNKVMKGIINNIESIVDIIEVLEPDEERRC